MTLRGLTVGVACSLCLACGTASGVDSGAGGGGGSGGNSGEGGGRADGGGGAGGGSDGGRDGGSSGGSDGGADAGCPAPDCGNPACTDVACVAPIPSTWTGYVALFDGQPSAVPACPAAFPTTDYTGSATLVAPPATCAACACGAPSGAFCAPSGGAPSIAAWTWNAAGRACGGSTTTATGCTDGAVCAPRPTAPFESGWCIEQPGDLACPAGAFTAKHLFYANVIDSRGCSSCSCGAAVGGSCAASGGAPLGGAQPSDPVTFCCIP